MNRHAKASSANTAARPGATRARRAGFGMACLCVLALAAFAGIGAPAALAAAPSVSVEAAEVGFTSAEAKGTIDPGGEGASYHYEYITDAKYNENLGNGHPGFSEGAEFAGFNFIAAAGPAEPAVLSPLAAGTTYHLRLVAENGGGETSSATTFTTQSATPAPVTIEPLGTPAYTTVHASGEVNPESGNVNPIGPTPVPIAWEFQVNREGAGWEFASGTPSTSQVIEGAEAESPTALTVEEQIEGLVPGASYEIRLRSFRAGAEAVSAEPFESFQTLAVTPPLVTTDDASSITASSAKFTGEVTNGNADPAFNSGCVFDYVTDARFQAEGLTEKSFASEEEEAKAKSEGYVAPFHIDCQPNPVEGEAAVPVEAEPTNLEPHQTYHLRLRATNLGGTTAVAAAHAFTTLAIPPSVQTIYAGDLHATSATLRGWVNPHNSPTTYYFLWGSEDCSANPCQSLPVSEDAPAGSGPTAVSAHQSLTGLSPETTYHYLLVATNSAGTEEALDRTFTTAASDQGACPNEARRSEQPLAFVLGDCRAWELATPGTSSDVLADSGRTVAAATESPGLPMAAKFSSLGGFSDIRGIGVASDYLSQRDAAPGTSGWALHAITPPQEPLSFRAAAQGVDPLYEAFSPDLSRGVFRSWSSLEGTSANATQVPNLYFRDDLRTPGAGSYQLLSDSTTPQPPLFFGGEKRPWFAGASTDLQHVLFETRLNLTPDAKGNNTKLYKSDAGAVRLVSANATCPGSASSTSPCSIAGIGATGHPAAHYTPRVISADGSRVNFTGAVSKLYQLDDRGTAATADDALIQLSRSEKASPEPAKAATYRTASTDGNRVFFSSEEQLTEAPGSGLYEWQRQSEDETQELSLDATGGTFTLTAHAQPSYGSGELTSGSNEVTAVTGSFTVGQTITGQGIPAGTTITQVSPGTNIVISNPATETATHNLTAGFQATTGPLPFNATAAQVQAALEGLSSIGAGNVALSGGPGATAPFQIEFTGALAGVDVMQLTTDATGLSGGASTATVITTNDVRNLTLISAGGSDVLGASEDGTRVYFRHGNDIELWTDDGSPAGASSFVATLSTFDIENLSPSQIVFWNFSRQPTSRVTPDGRFLLFDASDGAGLPPGYQHGPCSKNANGSNNRECSEAYVYRADTSTPTEPDIVCASCNLAVPGAAGDTFLNVREGAGGSLTANHLPRALSDDGKRVFFDTEERLVEEDTNGAVDVYEYDVPTGEVHLISSGAEPHPSYLMDASADGSDVFFVTTAQLAGWDDDQGYDLYDARVGGGFPEPPAQTAPCEGESCRGGSPATPGATAPGTASLIGPGNPKPRLHHRKHHKKKHRRHHHRNANNNRRAGR